MPSAVWLAFQFNPTERIKMNKEITLPVSELKSALPGLGRIIGRSRTLPVLQSVRITRDHEGHVRLHATDLDSFVSYKLSGNQSGAVTDIVLPLEHLTKAVKGTSATDTITLIPEAKDRVRIKRPIAGSTMEHTIETLSPAEWPEVPKVKQPGVQLEPEFGKSLKEALALASDDPSRFVLQGACLDVTDKKFHYIVGTNGRALYSANSFCFALKKSIIIPNSKFLSATDLMDESPCFLSVEPGEEKVEPKKGQPGKEAAPGWVRLESPRWTLVTREILGQFPNWKQVVPPTTDKWTGIELSDEAVKEMLKVIPNLPGGENQNRPITLSVDSDVVLSGRNNTDEEWTNVPVKTVKVHGNRVTVCLNREYFTAALKFGLKHLDIEDGLTPVVFTNGGRKMVIMPIRLDGAPVTEGQPRRTGPASEESAEQQQSPPSITEAQAERTEMPRTSNRVTETNRIETAEPLNGNGNGHEHTNGTPNGAEVKSIADHVDLIKESLKGVIRELNAVVDSLKQAEKEKRASDREVESIMNKLRQIQNVTI
jgi:DNA polymerase III sliding clamp (beta) subunit (PCNA family)